MRYEYSHRHLHTVVFTVPLLSVCLAHKDLLPCVFTNKLGRGTMNISKGNGRFESQKYLLNLFGCICLAVTYLERLRILPLPCLFFSRILVSFFLVVCLLNSDHWADFFKYHNHWHNLYSHTVDKMLSGYMR